MHTPSFTRFPLNALMLFLIPLSLLNKITGSLLHEILGFALVLLIGIHAFLNRHWFTLFWRQKKSFHRLLNTITLLLILMAFGVLIISSLMITKYLFSFLAFKSTLMLRQLHTTSAYWFFLLGFIHLGIHWHRFSALLQKKFRIHVRLSHPLLTFIAWLIVLYAGFVFIQRDIVSKLLMTFAFEFWDSTQSLISVAFDYMSMAVALMILTRFVVKLQKRFQRFLQN